MSSDGKHRSADPLGGPLPRRAVLLGGSILAAGAAIGVTGAMNSSSPARIAGHAAAISNGASGKDRHRTSPLKGAASAPLIHTTETWGARKPEREATVQSRSPRYIVIHHTSTDNVDDFSLARGKRLARAIQNAHMDDRGWTDTGQHFTISRGGHILEGRTGSLAAAREGEMVVGTHARQANPYSVGIECEGMYNTLLPPRPLLASLVRMCAWLCVQYDLDPRKVIVPHRKFNETDCCGDKFAPTLPRLADEVAKAIPKLLG
jgi:hypothetical protein